MDSRPPVPPNRSREVIRWSVRAAALVAAALLLSPLSRSEMPAKYLVSASPFVALSSVLATGTVGLAVGVGLAMTVLVTWRRRWFCRWVCPTGLCVDAASHLGRRCGRRRPGAPALGTWLALFTLGGAVVGYPLFLWLDPLALFSNSFTAPQAASRAVAWLCALPLPVLILLSLVWPGVWCMRLCPLGATQDLLAQFARSVWRATRRADRESRRSTLRLGRRAALWGGAGLVLGWLVPRGAKSVPRPLRPPGAAAPPRFTGLCLRCGSCVRACPARILTPDVGQYGAASFLSPVVRFRGDYCREDCVLCSEVCPSGAIGNVARAAKAQAKIGLARVDMDICLLSDERECGACRNHCPFDAIGIAFSPETYSLTVIVAADRCPGCGACEVACPTKPAKAIRVVPA